MEWRDEGIVIGLRRHGESSSIVEAMTRAHGRHTGLVRGGRSPRLGAALQPGNSLGLVWRARLDEHLGAFRVEPLSLRAGRLLSSALALAGLGYLGALLRLLPERDPHEGLFDALGVIVDHLDDPSLAPALVARFEARILSESGYALDLEACAATGAPWRDRLLPLPAFLRPGVDAPTPDGADVADAFRLTGLFLDRDLFAPRGQPLPDSRRAFLAAAAKSERSGR